MKKLIIPFLTLTMAMACTMPEPDDPQMARTQRVNGLLVFIHSEPFSTYEVVGRLEHDPLTEIAREAKNKKLGQALGDIYRKTTENLSLREQVYKMTELAKTQYPQANALIIDDKIFEAQVIEFR